MFNNFINSAVVASLPAQMISASKKDEEWKHKCMDALETIGRNQYLENLSLIENYEMVKGRFVYNHYFENDGYSDMMAQLTREFELPSYLRHYDIISQVVNTLSGEQQKRPDIYRIKDRSETATNEFRRTKTDLVLKYVTSQIQAEVSAKLLEQGLDETKQDFESEEEAQQYQQILEQARQALTPSEIQQYMETDWRHAAEIWAQHQLDLDKDRFRLAEKEKKEFEDMLVADRCFRHFYLTPTGYNQETWNPVQVFFHKSPDVEEIENGDYVGRVFHLSTAGIIDRYGYKLTKKEIEGLEERLKTQEDKRWNYMKGTEYVFNEYMVPFQGFQVYDTINKTIPHFDQNTLGDLTSGKYFNDKPGLYRVTEAYWKSQEKIGKVTFIDPETGVLTKRLVDENFVVPDHFTELDENFADNEEVDTVVWTWINRVWKGTKINLKGALKDKDLYIDIKPIDFQFKGDLNPYDAKLPVCGQVFSARNSKSMSLVDLMKPYQIFYNVAMNQAYQIGEREIGRWAMFDVNMFPDAKDWGGEGAMEKVMLIAKQLGAVSADTSPANVQGALAAAGGQFPREFNWDDSGRLMTRIALAEKFEQMALRQVGFNQYRLGNYSSDATAGGVQAGQAMSFSQTESLFTNFSNYIRRCYEFDLAIAQYTQATKTDVGVMNIKSDMSRALIEVLGTDLLLADLHVYVLNSQEFIRQTEMLRQLALQNNTTGADALDLAEIITSSSPSEIKVKLKESRAKQDEMREREYQMKEKELAQAREIEMARMQKADEILDKQLDNKLDVAYITQGSKILSENDAPEDNTKERQLQLQESQAEENNSVAQQKLDLQRQKNQAEANFRRSQQALDQAEIEKDLQVQRDKIRVVETMKGKNKK